MSKIALDLKKFKHVKSDDHTTTLMHNDGHVLTMAHKALSPEFQKQLSALSKISSENSTPLQKDESKHANMAKGGIAGAFDEADEALATKPSGVTVTHKKPIQDQKPSELPPSTPDTSEADKDKGYTTYPSHLNKACGGGVPMYAKGGETPIEIKGSKSQFNAIPDDTPDSEAQMNQDINKEVEDSENFAHRTENPNYVAPVKEEMPPEIKPNPYADQYNKIYSQVKMLNPGLPDNMVRQQAMSVAEVQQDKDKADSRNLMDSQQQDHDMANQENLRRSALGLPPIPVPAQPNTAPPPPPSNVPAVEAPISQAQQQEPSGLPGAGSSHDPESMLSSGFNERMQGINKGAETQGALGQEQANLLNKNIEAQHMAQSVYKQTYQQLENERQDHMQDIKDGYVDPNAYWKDHSKIMSGIGMILAGFNPTNSPNAAINFLKFQMEQNLQAQKDNLGAKQNLLTANLRQFGNLKDATDMTRLMQHDIMSNSLQSAAAKAQSPMAKAAAMQAAGALQMEAAPMFQQFAMRRAMMNLADNGGSPESIDHMLGYMRVINPEMAKEMTSRYVPGIGLGKVPVPEAVRLEIVSHQKLEDAAKDLLVFTKNHTTINPLSSEYKIGAQKALVLQQMIREGMLGTVFRESEKPLLNKMVDENPAGFMKMISTDPKIHTILESNNAQLNSLKQSYGLPVTQHAPAQPQYKTVNGVKYMRGPNGESVRVK